MTQTEKTAIKSAEERLEQERKEKLQNEVYDFLKAELDEIDRLDANIREAQNEKRIHEENIKNVKQGNLQAIEARRKTLLRAGYFDIAASNPQWTFTSSSTFYPNYIAGMSVRSSSGKLYIF